MVDGLAKLPLMLRGDDLLDPLRQLLHDGFSLDGKVHLDDILKTWSGQKKFIKLHSLYTIKLVIIRVLIFNFYLSVTSSSPLQYDLAVPP